MTLSDQTVRYCRRGHRMEFVRSQGRMVCKICRRRYERMCRDKRRRQRLKERRQRIARRCSPPRRERVWTAGYFEGEGTITIAAVKTQNRIRPYIERDQFT